MWEYKISLGALDSFQLAMCTGLLIGDVSIIRNSNWSKALSHKLKFEWGDIHFTYAKSVYHSLELSKGLTSPREQIRTNINNVTTCTWCFQTVTVPAFNILAEAFMAQNNSTNKTPLAIVSELMTPVSLAYWYMDDGHCANRGREGLYLNTQGFTEEEVFGLCNILRSKFDLDCWLPRSVRGPLGRIYLILLFQVTVIVLSSHRLKNRFILI
jgi:hypothetical protein